MPSSACDFVATKVGALKQLVALERGGPSTFFNDTATTEIYTLSLHDALPIHARELRSRASSVGARPARCDSRAMDRGDRRRRSEEHTSELQSRRDLVCRL